MRRLATVIGESKRQIQRKDVRGLRAVPLRVAGEAESISRTKPRNHAVGEVSLTLCIRRAEPGSVRAVGQPDPDLPCTAMIQRCGDASGDGNIPIRAVARAATTEGLVAACGWKRGEFSAEADFPVPGLEPQGTDGAKKWIAACLANGKTEGWHKQLVGFSGRLRGARYREETDRRYGRNSSHECLYARLPNGPGVQLRAQC